MKQKDTNQAERLFSALGDLDSATVESARRYRPPRRASVYPVRRIVAVALASVLMLALITLTVFAAVPSLRGIINLPFLNENAKKDKVPEGWVGIYTVADLDAVRNDLNGKYILMNDLTFTEADGSFTPIGTKEEPFMGQFDGNGYVIRDLVIDVTQPAPPVIEGERDYQSGRIPYYYHDISNSCYVGLFAYCGYSTFTTGKPISPELHDLDFPYLFDDQPYRGMICNLGVENARVTVETASNVRVGVIAGQASYVVSSYVKDCTVELTGYEAQAEGSTFRLRMGGIAGNVQVLDSCYATNCTLTVTDTADLLSDGMYVNGVGNIGPKAAVFIGGLAGNAYTMVTSYAEGGEITCDYAANRQGAWWHDDHPAYTGDLYGHVHRIPSVMNYSHFRSILEAFYRAAVGLSADEPLPEDWYYLDSNQNQATFDFGKFRSFFIPKSVSILTEYYGIDPEHVNPSLLTGDFTLETEMYMFDHAARMEEIIWVENIAMEYIGEENLAEQVSFDNLKVGPIYCHVLDPNVAYNPKDFTEYNFKTVWKMKDGRPVLRIFG